MSLITLRESIRSHLAAATTDLVDVHTHGGRFDANELKRWALRAPCAVVALLGVPKVELEAQQLVASLQFGCFIITRDKPQLPRDTAAITLLQIVLGVIRPDERWDDADAHVADSIRAENLFNGNLDAQGVAIWAVTWRQDYDLNAIDITTLDDFVTYNSQVDLAGSPGATAEAEDTVTLPTA